MDNFAYLLLFSILFVQYNTVKHELSFLNPVESMPMNNLLLYCQLAIRRMKLSFPIVYNLLWKKTSEEWYNEGYATIEETF